MLGGGPGVWDVLNPVPASFPCDRNCVDTVDMRRCPETRNPRVGYMRDLAALLPRDSLARMAVTMATARFHFHKRYDVRVLRNDVDLFPVYTKVAGEDTEAAADEKIRSDRFGDRAE